MSEDITLLENPSEISDKKVAPIEQTGEKTHMNPTNPKTTNDPETSTHNLMMMDGSENENLPEEVEFDDATEVDYDLDYTVQY